ncbi:MAG: 3-oxoacyl-ACP synthase [Nitrospirae bacterium CG_4_10_14_0_8_um_filter_41_23]|nr:ketoacyl-ACP synthase III [Nitrospirota bacterium]OIP59294.1 MAG: 3-oxoacyl-ACP synthase [Nitrospirae bacterium CG2_30_41_42]PIV43396.1 MAG: 3-oxoacyl-ACP synthase [Nitrospirae bacterium CG02_land_8_20_14_3_00_41_53]PIY86778.1 MAG: 3-oxoacyl-ACP synthase [Nitrospirae bacterium CG_4_10_14_0_8_um_filter_41_23]PJA79459.1 MAG: 3-oxoacyl-ACP synthase [Nitrospirae bacterium CG_4_9_14_3_um_filter_41_27]
MLRSRIISTGSYLPEKVLTNDDLEKMVDTSDEWITERTGIKERRIADESQAASDLAYEASKAALERAGLKADDIDLIIVATVTGDMPFPSTACILQDKLGAVNAVGFDINATCSGFLYSLYIADSLIKSRMHKRILVVGAEVLSRITDWEDKTTCVIFGDGAGAVIIEPTEEDRGILSMHINSDGRMWELLHMPGGGSRNPASIDTIKKKLHYIKMKGNETFKVAVRTLEDLVVKTLDENKLDASRLSLLIPHQANLRIIQATADRIGIPMDKVIVNIERYGNTSAASIPIALDEAVRTERIRDGDYILLEAFGGGFTWASALIRW